MKVLVTGSRWWGPKHVDIIHRELVKFPEKTIIVHGACRGVDEIAGEIAKELNFIVRDYPANWKKFENSAGPIRNRQMVSEEHKQDEPIDLILAFHDDIDKSTGTSDMIAVGVKAGISYKLVTQ